MSITQISGRFVDVVFGIQVSSQNLFQIHCQGAQLLVVATREQHERSCFERMFTETGQLWVLDVFATISKKGGDHMLHMFFHIWVKFLLVPGPS